MKNLLFLHFSSTPKIRQNLEKWRTFCKISIYRYMLYKTSQGYEVKENGTFSSLGAKKQQSIPIVKNLLIWKYLVS